MKIYKIRCHLKCFFKKIIYKFNPKIKIGSKTSWRRNFLCLTDGGTIEIGKDCFFNNDCSITSKRMVKIGNGCLFGENVKLYDHNHKFRKANISIKNQGFSIGEIIIGDNCWIGSNVTILKGAKIGNNCVIGAGCIIDFKVEDYTIIKNNCQIIKIDIKEAQN